MGVNEKEIVTREAELLTLAKRVEGLAEAVKQAGPMPELIEALRQSRIEREAAENALVILRSTVVSPAGTGWNEMGEVWKLEADDAQRLAAMLRMAGYHITVQNTGEIISSHSDVLYRYIGVDRALDRYKLLVNGKLSLIPKEYVDDYTYHEPFQEVEGEVTWNVEDYTNLQAQYK